VHFAIPIAKATSGHLTSGSLAFQVSFFARLFCTRPAIAMDKAHASCGGHVSKIQAWSTFRKEIARLLAVTVIRLCSTLRARHS
jgi:hypothetical protein